MSRDDGALLGAVAVMLALALLFMPKAPEKIALAPRCDAASPIAWHDGQALIDLNKADADLLSTLPGIGAALSNRIVQDRAANGPFPSAEGLLRVAGIGPAKLAKIAPRVVAIP